MEYRVYDTEQKKWIDNKMYLTSDGQLYIMNQSVLGWTKLSELPQERYVYHRAIDLWDKENIQVYEGDYIQAQVDDDRSVVGLVAFAQDLSAYVILVESTQEFFTLGSEVTKFIQVVGNVFDGYEVIQDGEQAL